MNCDLDNIRKKRNKKQTIKSKTKNVNKITANGTKQLNKITSLVSEKMVNGKKRIKNKVKRTILKNADDKTPFLKDNNFINITEDETIIPKKGVKRKRNTKSTHILLKKTKTETNVKEKISFKTSKNKLISKQTSSNNAFQQEKVELLSKKLKRKKTKNEPVDNEKQNNKNTNKPIMNSQITKKRKEQLEKLKLLISNKGPLQTKQATSKKQKPILTLRQKMMRKLKAARFRFLNEQIYNTTSQETEKVFRRDPEAFKAYHEGYKQQVKKWPLNPVDKIIKSLNKVDKNFIIADFGCGEAKLAKSLKQKVHSFDLVAANELVTVCDMAHVPLEDSSVDVVVFCLSLMGTNLKDYFVEANRILKNGGMLKIAEVESRFDDVNAFIKSSEQFGFKKTWMDLSYNLFYFIDFKKESNVKDKKKLPTISLQPCLYKKR